MSDQTPAGPSPEQEPPAESTPPPPPAPAAAQQGGAAAPAPAAGPSPAEQAAARQAEEDEEARQRRRRVLALLIVVLILLLLLLCGLGYVLFIKGKNNANPGPSSTTSAPVVPATTPQTTAPATPTDTGTPTPTPTPTATPTPTQPPAQNITVPDLKGKTAADATTALKQAGFTKAPTFKSGDAGVQFDPNNSSFTVSAQNPAAGTQAPSDTEIVLTMTQTGNGGKG